MPRKVKVATAEMGLLDVYIIYERDGVWEEEWRPLQHEKGLGDQLPTVSKDQMEQAFIGWTRPLVAALGPPPKGMLLTIPRSTRECHARESCPFYRPASCVSTAKETPWCFVPSGITEERPRQLAAECVRLWREGVYIVVVREPTNVQ